MVCSFAVGREGDDPGGRSINGSGRASVMVGSTSLVGGPMMSGRISFTLAFRLLRSHRSNTTAARSEGTPTPSATPTAIPATLWFVELEIPEVTRNGLVGEETEVPDGNARVEERGGSSVPASAEFDTVVRSPGQVLLDIPDVRIAFDDVPQCPEASYTDAISCQPGSKRLMYVRVSSSSVRDTVVMVAAWVSARTMVYGF